MGGLINIGSLLGDKKWFQSMTVWGLIVFALGETFIEQACGPEGAGIFSANACAIMSGISDKVAVVLTVLGLRRAAV